MDAVLSAPGAAGAAEGYGTAPRHPQHGPSVL
ncbi:hypothetical protein [Archangium lansingense]